jgi:hypothetical protein
MTVPNERTRAVNATREFLIDLLNHEKYPRLPKKVRDRSLSLLKHYPTAFDMHVIADKEDGLEQLVPIKVFGHSWR